MKLSKPSIARTLQIVLLFTAMFSSMGGPALAPALPSIKATFATLPDIEFWTKALVAITGLFSALGILIGIKFIGLFMSPFIFQPILAHLGYHIMFRFAGGFMLFAACVIWTLKFKEQNEKQEVLS